MDGRVKTLHPRLYAGLLAVRDDPEHLEAAGRARHRVRRPRVREPLPVRAHRRAPRRRRGRGHREHRHRRADDDPRGGQEPRVRGGRHVARSPTTPCSTSCARPTARCRCRRAGGWPPRRSPTRRATTRRSRAGSPRAPRASRRRSCAPTRRSSTCPTARTRTSGPPTTSRSARAATCCRRCSSTTARRSPTTTSSTSTPPARSSREFEEPACVIVKHNNPCGAALGSDGAERLPARLRAADPVSAFGGIIALNRPGRRGDRRGALASSSSRCCSRPGYDEGALEILDAQAERADPRGRGAPRPGRASSASRQVEGGLLVQDRDATLGPGEAMEVVTGRAPDRAGVARPAASPGAVCRAREVQRDRAGPRRARPSGIGAGPDEPRRRVRLAVEKSPLDSLQGAALASDAFFPFADGPGAGDRGRRHGDHPAGRLGARRRGRRGGRRGRRGDGLHRPAALPPLRPVPRHRRHGSGAPWEPWSATAAWCARRPRLVAGTHGDDATARSPGWATPTRRRARPWRTSRRRSSAPARALSDVVRTRMYVTDIDRAGRRSARVHGEVFGDIRPVTAMVQVAGADRPAHAGRDRGRGVVAPSGGAPDRAP